MEPQSIEESDVFCATSLEMSIRMIALAGFLHIKDHEGYDCAREHIKTFMYLFELGAKEELEKLCNEKGYDNPFSGNDINLETRNQILKELEENDE